MPGVSARVIGIVSFITLICATVFLVLFFVVGENQTPSAIARWVLMASGFALFITLAFDYLRRHGNLLFFK